jgi:hypothetical protein
MMERDLTLKQFLARAAAYGWKPEGFLGYFRKDYGRYGAYCVSIHNGGYRRRSQLAYLIREGEEADKRFIKKDETVP